MAELQLRREKGLFQAKGSIRGALAPTSAGQRRLQQPHDGPDASPRLQQDEADVDAAPTAGLQGAPALATKRRLCSRFRATAHWLLVATGRMLTIVLLALAGTRGQGRVLAMTGMGVCVSQSSLMGQSRSDPECLLPTPRHSPPIGLLQCLPAGLPGHLHVVGLPLSSQPPGL